jgi:hypothetical protein
VSGPVTVTVTPPAGVPAPASFPLTAQFSGGQAVVRAKFTAPGYYRLMASGPGGAVGWMTVTVLGPHQRAYGPSGLPRSTF